MRKGVVLVLGLLVAVQAAAVTLHRSFRRHEVGIGGGASVEVPVEYVGRNRQNLVLGVIYRKSEGVKAADGHVA